ncbi:MAG: HD domain-containing protein [Planctomycetes bacterium]|nr:HD domain-containing protein [Planctomycetota bacterium]MCG2682685.1 HD domain-containing protein [Planctomycetales bacterium]
MRDFQSESLSHDPIHGYIPFTSPAGLPDGEVSEREIIDHPWLQRLRQIHQLQTAWWVFPTAEHTRFQHVLGAMHLASRAVAELYDSLREVCPEAPGRGYVESLMRMAALLHDVGHGPFGHFFDRHFLADYGLNHELLGGEIIRREFAEPIRRVRRNPNSRLEDGETLDPEQIVFLMTRPVGASDDGPRWLRFLRALFSGLYTVDNMDFVLRDAYMSGYSARAFDLDRLLHYSAFTEKGLTIHERGLSALVRFISVRAELFRAIYFHRTVRAIDLELQELFQDGKRRLFPGDPRQHLDQYQRLTEWSLLMEVARWPESSDPELRELGGRWREFLARRLRWKMACERTVFFAPGEAEQGSVLSNVAAFEAAVRAELPPELKDLPLRVDTARHVHRPGAHTPASGQNFLLDPATGSIHDLDQRMLFRRIAISFRICRIYALDDRHNIELAAALDRLTGAGGADDATNM